MRFKDRQEAGLLLAQRLEPFRDEDPLVLGLPRGGMVVAQPVADRLEAPLGAWVARKVSSPKNPEFAIAAVSGPVVLRDDNAIHLVGLDGREFQRLVRKEQRRLGELQKMFEAVQPTNFAARTLILIDDGVATGLTAIAAVRALRDAGAKRVVLAVPVAPSDTVERLRKETDELIVLERPSWFSAVGDFYSDFGPVRDDDIFTILHAAQERRPETPAWEGTSIAA